MPSSPDATPALSQNLLQALDDVNGLHAGFRPAHAKGVLLSGTFTPSPGANSLTRAPHVQRESTPVTVRFSDSAGFPAVADNDQAYAGPRGIAIRFHLSEHVHTDIIGHSYDGFPSRTPEEFLDLLRAIHASGPDAPKPAPIEVYLGAHPAALKFVTAPKPIPSSFARESFFTVNAFKFTNKDGVSRFGRFRVRPQDGNDYLDATAAAAKSPNFLFDELAARISKGSPVTFQVVVQLASKEDVTDNATVNWPEDRAHAEFGAVVLTRQLPDDAETRRLIFDPIPRVDGIDPSADPLLEARADLYLLSGRRRRAASEPTAAKATGNP
jgi:catalase